MTVRTVARGSELSSIGPLVCTLAFDVGNPDLAAQNSLSLDLTLRHRSHRVCGELISFAYNIDNSISDNLVVCNILQAKTCRAPYSSDGRVVNTITYWAYSKVSARSSLPFL